MNLFLIGFKGWTGFEKLCALAPWREKILLELRIAGITLIYKSMTNERNNL
jgi:hypothetical protein